MIVIVNYGMGNLCSIQNMLKKIGASSVVSSERSAIEKADKLILPGVGAFDHAMKNLAALDIVGILNKKVINDKVPILGICLGIQLFTKRSDEGVLPGLGWIDAETIAFSKSIDTRDFKIPHMGWNTVSIQKYHPIFKDENAELRFYFVHSYFLKCNDKSDVLTNTRYGIEFASAIQKNNIIGVQFHPEKSHNFGMNLLYCFSKL
jgi:imidazole glycerol-phosphate synthase subunit HisH